MRHKGSYLEYEKKRNQELLDAYNREFRQGIPPKLIYKRIINSPCSRFWVSEERAYYAVMKLLAGEMIDVENANKRAMFHDIYTRVLERMQAQPRDSLFTHVIAVVGSPAPRFYLSPESAKVIICRIRKGWYEKRRITNNRKQK